MYLIQNKQGEVFGGWIHVGAANFKACWADAKQDECFKALLYRSNNASSSIIDDVDALMDEGFSVRVITLEEALKKESMTVDQMFR